MAEKKVIELLVSGGKANAGPPLGPALGPLGVNILSIVNKINELTKDYAGMKVPVKIMVNIENKDFEVNVGTPTTAALIVSELKITKGSGEAGTNNVGNLNMDQILRIAKIKQDQSLGKNIKNTVKEVLGTCVSVGVTVEQKDPREVQSQVDEGLYKEIITA